MRAILAALIPLSFCFSAPFEAKAEPAWAYGAEGESFYAAASGTKGTRAIVSLKKGRAEALLFITGIWNTRPLELRLWVKYANGRRVPIDTYRFAEIIELRGTRAYKLELKRRDLQPLKGGDVLVIEDLNRRAEVPLTGSSKAIKAAEASAAQGG